MAAGEEVLDDMCVSVYMAGDLGAILRCGRRLGASSPQSQVPQYPQSGFAAFKNGRHHQVRAAHHVPAREDLRVRGLKA